MWPASLSWDSQQLPTNSGESGEETSLESWNGMDVAASHSHTINRSRFPKFLGVGLGHFLMLVLGS